MLKLKLMHCLPYKLLPHCLPAHTVSKCNIHQRTECCRRLAEDDLFLFGTSKNLMGMSR